ncbi:MAG TPA: DUF4838 domain-containing protein, partial [Armatimonadetes bacterium]|nr:DUF4838 domain-containing protein [Armatimonadota bacterium]
MWRLLCGLLLLGSNSAVGAGLRLIENAQPRCAIVVPTLASPVEQQAAAELAHYLQLMSGAEVPIISAGEPVAQPYRLLVGRAEQVLAQPPKLHPEGFLLRTVDDGLIIAGGSDLGTLFAVYDFLERLGCRWLVPGELGQVVPLRPTVTVKDWNVVERPAFEIRSFALTGGGERAEWGLRNKINGFYSLEFAEAHGGALSFQPGTAGFHSFFQTLPAEEYFPDHPEIFPLLGGKRMKYSVRGGQLCTTNPEAVALAASVVRRYFREHPTARIYTLSPNDGYGWCECERCRAFDEQYAAGRTHASGRPITTDRLMYFLNQVQAQLRGEFPGRRLVTLSYVNYVEPPTTYVPEADIIAFQCHYTPACYAHPITDPDCPENRKFDAHLRRWVEVLRRARGEGQPVNLGIYAYTDKSMWFYLPRPVVRQMAADIQHFYELGIRSYYAQSSASVWALNLPLYYLTAKLLWNPQQDVEALLDDFYTNFFAAAAEPMRAYYQTFEEALARSRAHFNADPLSEAPPLLTPEV